MPEKQQILIKNILEHARWAPSGDNMQTWRFEIVSDRHFIVHGYDTRDHCVYDLQGHASQLAIGALLESIVIAASAFQHKVEFEIRQNLPDTKPTVDIFLVKDDTVIEDTLFPYLPIRSVQRRMLKTTPLSPEQKNRLEKAVGGLYAIKWRESLSDRVSAAWLMYKNAKLRLTLPEAYPTHSTIIEWNSQFSNDKIPDQAVGLDPIATKLMKWAMQSWERVDFLNNFLAGTLLPRIELDLLPGIFCAAHFSIIAKQEPVTVADYLQAGRAVQRFWLTAAELGLNLQPEMTPLIFSSYVRENIPFTQENKLFTYAEKLSDRFASFVDNDCVKLAVFVGRIGKGAPVKSRSLRLSVEELLVN